MVKMSVSDPYIKDLKRCTYMLMQQVNLHGKILDSNPHLTNFCNVLETIFHSKMYYFTQSDKIKKLISAYTWISSIPEETNKISFKYVDCLAKVEKCPLIKTEMGKFRLLLRYFLVKECVHEAVQYILDTNRIGEFYKPNSIIGDEILCQIFLSVLLQCSKISFDLNLDNVSFLDETWELPQMLKLELVPCNNLGIGVSFSKSRAVIINVDPESVAGEQGFINIGDTLYSINGTIINSSHKGKLTCLLKSNRGKPINLVILKALKENGELFKPITDVLENVNLNFEKIKKLQEETNGKCGRFLKGFGFKCKYLGYVIMGKHGDAKQIDKGIKAMFHSKFRNDPKVKNVERVVYFQIGELSLKVVSDSNEEILSHCYIDISSCGMTPAVTNYFGYIVGEANFEFGSKFNCHVFYSDSYGDICAILKTIAEGFQRTHFAV